MSNHDLEFPLRIGKNRADENKRDKCTEITCEALLAILTELYVLTEVIDLLKRLADL